MKLIANVPYPIITHENYVYKRLVKEKIRLPGITETAGNSSKENNRNILFWKNRDVLDPRVK